MQEPLNWHGAPSTGQIQTIDPILLSIFPAYGVIYYTFILGTLDQFLHVFQK